MVKKVVKRKSTAQRTISGKATEAGNLTDDVAAQRRQELADNFPQLNPEDFASDEVYREALLKQYQAMRQEEYRYVCLNEGIKAYDVSLSICSRTGNSKIMNREAWSGCKNVIKKYPDLREAVADSCYARIPQYVTNTLSGGSANCCAVSSKALESKISAEMGFDGDDNFVKPYHTYPDAGCHRFANGFMSDPALEGYTEHGDLWSLVSEGKVGPGSTIATPSRTASGYHAKTVIAVNYDENGNLKNYVLQGNNRNNLEVVTSRLIYSNVYAGDMNRWMTNKLKDETNQKAQLSIDDLAKEVEQQRQQLSDRIDALEKTENHLFTSKGSQQKVIDYADTYVKSSHVPGAIMRIDAQNAEQEQDRIEKRLLMFNSASATNAPRESSAVEPEKMSVPDKAADRNTDRSAVKLGNDISEKDKAKMRSMLTNLNRINGKKTIDVEESIAALSNQFGPDASKVLTKIMMAPGQIAKQLNLVDKNGKPITSSREVLMQLCQSQNEEQNQQVLALVSAQKRSRGNMA